MTYTFITTLHPYGQAPTAGIIQIDPAARYGYFERRNGEEGGGLWFDRTESGGLELSDYDGLTALPAAIINALRANGVTVDAAFE